MNTISKSELEALYNHQLDFLFLFNVEGKIVEVSSTVTSILEYSRDELNSNSLFMVYSSLYRDKVSKAMPSIVKGDITSFPYPLISKTGEIIPTNTKFYEGYWDDKNVFVAVCTNLSVKYFTEEILFNIFNSSEVMLGITGMDSGAIFNVNTTFLKKIGYSLEEVSGKTVYELGVYSDYSRRAAMLQQLATEDKAEGEATIVTKSGKEIECLLSYKQIKIHQDDYLLTAVTDISSRKLIEEDLRRLNGEQKLLADVAQLFNKSDDFDKVINAVLTLLGQHSKVSRIYIFENTADGLFTNNNYEWCNEGIPARKDQLQMVPLETMPSLERLLKEECHISSADTSNLPEDIKSVLLPLDAKSLLIYPICIANHLWGFMGYNECTRNRTWLKDEVFLFSTVTNSVANALERRLYLKKAQDNENRLRLALRGAHEGLWDWNLLNNDMYFTDTCYTMLGYEPDDSFKAVDWWRGVIHPEDLDRVLRTFDEHLNDQTSYYESVFRVKDQFGEWKWILDHGMIVERDQQGKPIRVVGTHINITKQKQTELELQDVINTKNNLFSIISHDLRGPIGNFMQMIELLTSDEVAIAPDMQSELLKELKGTSRNTFYLLENLLNWSRSQRSEIEYNPQSFVLNEVIAQNVSLLSTMAAQKFIDIQFDDKASHVVYADHDMINLIVRNLLSNAIKFTRLHGRITISSHQQDKFIEVVIADNGVGMPPEVVTNLFTNNKFRSTYGTSNEKGSGLGLVLCHDFILRNGGTLRVESVLGEGSQFIFTIPLHA